MTKKRPTATNKRSAVATKRSSAAKKQSATTKKHSAAVTKRPAETAKRSTAASGDGHVGRDQAEASRDHLAWFLGPKAENRAIFEEVLLQITRDYMHWRSNYFPGDKILIPRQLERQLATQFDDFHDRVHEMMAGLRRNFPFYSPRYIAHMLSDTTMPSMLGYFAGMLYNANNVTTEAAPVTTEWEFEACNAILEMLGFAPPPSVRRDETREAFLARLPSSFGWAHTTFDGTTATIESLWIARTVKYIPLAIKDVVTGEAVSADDELMVQRVKVLVVDKEHPIEKPISDIPDESLLLLEPTKCLDLVQNYFNAATMSPAFNRDGDAGQAVKRAWQALRSSRFDLVSQGLGSVVNRYHPVIFATASAHYCLRKAVDILGWGSNSIIEVDMDGDQRMDVQDLRKKFRQVVKLLRSNDFPKPVPLAVFAVCGSTEFGAVDPIHEIVEFRGDMASAEGAGFWLHVDAAWGGYVRTLYRPDDKNIVDQLYTNLAVVLKLPRLRQRDPRWYPDLRVWIEQNWTPEEDAREVVARLRKVRALYNQKRFGEVKEALYDFIAQLEKQPESWPVRSNVIDENACISDVTEAASQRAHLTFDGESVPNIDLSWPGSQKQWLHQAFLRIDAADSVVCDPHKLGYGVYPCGVAAFRDNRVRQCIWQDTPYISAIGPGKTMFNVPVRYPSEDKDPKTGKPKIITEAYAKFILEGSRPGAVASALWLATKTIALNRSGHGRLICTSLWAARELYAWLANWNRLANDLKRNPDYQFVPVTGAPDTNVVTFVVKRMSSRSLEEMNSITNAVYEKFSIQTELGEREYSYSQDFFLSHTRAEHPKYPYSALKKFLGERCELNVPARQGAKDELENEYKEHGVSILRATVMSPYLYSIRAQDKEDTQNLVRDFIDCLANAAKDAVITARSAHR